MPDEEPGHSPAPEPAGSGAPVAPEAAEAEPQASSPFDHPYFLPALLFVFAAWFGYDGWYNEEIEAVMFNRYGFFVLLAGGVYTTLENFVVSPYLLPGFLVGGGLVLAGRGWLVEPNEQTVFDQIASLTLFSVAAFLVVQSYVRSPFLLPGVLVAGSLVLASYGWLGEETENDIFARIGSVLVLIFAAYRTLRAVRSG